MRDNNSIRLSPTHGVNPCIPRCFFCGKDKGEVWLLGQLPNDAEAPVSAVFDKQPCDNCAALMCRGILLISVRDGESGDNPYRTGKQVVLREEAVRNSIQSAELADAICRMRMAFVPDAVWIMLGIDELIADSKEEAT